MVNLQITRNLGGGTIGTKTGLFRNQENTLPINEKAFGCNGPHTENLLALAVLPTGCDKMYGPIGTKTGNRKNAESTTKIKNTVLGYDGMQMAPKQKN